MTPALTNTDLAEGIWVIDPVHSSINFSVRHLVVSTVRGRFGSFSGTIIVGPDGAPTVTANIDVLSINTGNEQRDGHIKSPDFFDVANYPTATFTSTSVTPDGDSYLLDGEFTLKGVSKPITLKLDFNGVNPGMGHGVVAGFEATTVLNRKDFGIDLEMPLDGGGVVVGDKVSLTLEIEALQQLA